MKTKPKYENEKEKTRICEFIGKCFEHGKNRASFGLPTLKKIEELMVETEDQGVEVVAKMKKDKQNDRVFSLPIPRECYETPTEIIVCGTPDPEDESHDCDEMGCTSVSHVLYRFRK